MNWDGYQYTRLGILTSVYNPVMPLVDQIQKDIVTAMKAKDEARLSTLRMVKSALQLRQVEKMGPLDDKESQTVLATLIKQRKDSIEQFTAGGRQDLVDKEKVELQVLESYLPARLGADEIAAEVAAVVAETGASGAADMGKVMAAAKARFAGRAEMGLVSAAVKAALAR